MRKIYILGIAGSGKSTLAKELSKILKIPKFDLDDIFFIEKYTHKRKDEDCEKELKKLLKENDCWIIEGVYSWGKIAANKADLVIWLNYGINTSTYRVIKRWILNHKEDKESIKELYGLIKYVRSYKKVRANKIYSTYEKHQEVISGNEHKLFEIKNKEDLERLFEELKINSKN